MSVGILVDVGKSMTSFSSEVVSIDLDVTLDETHEWSNEVTTSPVETGSPIADHIQRMPDKLSITGFISDSSISSQVIEQYSSVDASMVPDITQNTFDMLHFLMNDKKIVTVYTKFKIYTDMVLTSISIPRSAASGNAI